MLLVVAKGQTKKTLGAKCRKVWWLLFWWETQYPILVVDLVGIAKAASAIPSVEGDK